MRGGRGGGGYRGGGGRIGGSRSGSGRIGGAGRGGGMGGGLGGAGRRPSVHVGPGMGMGGFGMGGFGMGGRRRRRGMHFGGGGGCGGCAFPSMLLVIVVIILLIVILSNANMFGGGTGGGGQITPSTVRREALPSGSAIDSGPLFTDHLGWIGNQTQLNVGLQNFFNVTGVRPHVYIVGEIDGSSAVPTIAQLNAFAGRRYSELFNDEAHLLLVFFENANHEYAMYVMPGNMARSVMDDEARDILMDYIQRYYYNTNISEEVLFSRAFNNTGVRIMTITRSPWIPVMVVVGVLAALMTIFTWWKKAKEQKNLEAEQTERILGQSLEEISGDYDEASQLAKQYQDDEEEKK